MITFPVLQSLTFERYGLYPKSEKQPFEIDFLAGPNAVVGVNGSGKTTLISVALHCLSGPYNLPAATSEAELGHVRARVVEMDRPDRQMYARRVADSARTSTATLVVSFKNTVVTITRRLSDLSLVELLVDGKRVAGGNAKSRDETVYQARLAELFGVASFFDVLIVLRFLVFMLEDRRALVWDPTAQRQIYRVLLLPKERATEYAEAQQGVISSDSSVRNMSAFIYRREKDRGNADKRVRKIHDAEAERRVLTAEANGMRKRIEAVANVRVEADAERQAARLLRVTSAETRESITRQLERLKMRALGRRLASSSETTRYLLGHLLAEKECLVCGANPSPAASTINDWVRAGRCPLCGSEHETAERVVPISHADRKRISRLESELAYADQQIAAADARIADAQRRFAVADAEYDQLEQDRLALDLRIVAVLKRIPSERAAIGTANDDIDTLNRLLADERRQLTTAEERFRTIVEETVGAVEALQEAIATAFQRYLKLFIREDASLVYQTTKARIGQAGESFDFPTFRLAMTGGAVAGATIRTGPDAVSQSQAEFIDLAFRMALISVASQGRPASLVVDAPEAALDFLFAERAGQQLAAFAAAHPENRVIVTSYLPSAHLLMAFLSKARSEKERRRRIVDLIRDAAPNAAVRADRRRYEKFLNAIIKKQQVANV